MGFAMSIVILHRDARSVGEIPDIPECEQEIKTTRRSNKDYVVWRGREIISFGRIARVEKLEDPHLRSNQEGQRVAGVCAGSWIVQQLSKKHDLSKGDFAPPFLVSEDNREVGFIWEHHNLAYENLRGGEEFTDPVWSHSGWSSPSRETMLGHNKGLLFSEEKFATLGREFHDVVVGQLVRWEAAGVVAEWLAQLPSAERHSSSLLHGDSVALAYLKVWQVTLKELGGLGARVLFVFDHSTTLEFL